VLALLLGMLVAATAFTVLTAAARTAQLRTIGTVSSHFRPAYHILVRPAGARSRLESATGTVQPDFLAGIYGGISMAQYRQIQHIAGVQVAAPIAMVGYTLMYAAFPVWLPAADVHRTGRQLYRVSTTWVSANGASRYSQPPAYVYVTPDRVKYHHSGAQTELLPGGKQVTTCPVPSQERASSPFSFAGLAESWCWSKVNGQGAPATLFIPDLGSRPGFALNWQFPMLIAAIDPAAEARLDGLNHALTFGKYLPESGFGTGSRRTRTCTTSSRPTAGRASRTRWGSTGRPARCATAGPAAAAWSPPWCTTQSRCGGPARPAGSGSPTRQRRHPVPAAAASHDHLT
jgi:hypothetical protein